MDKIKIAVCQLGLRDTHSFQEMEQHLEEQCRLALRGKPHLVLLPEFSCFGLLGMAGAALCYADLEPAMKKYLAEFTPIYEALFTRLARESGAVVVGGSHWVWDSTQGMGYNTAHIFFPDGSIQRQRKNHLFPGETDWGTATFDGLETFKVGPATVGVMTCYDSEFPEVGRHFMLSGAQILLCPSDTYTERGFYRVRRCCAARAVENQVYVVECHLVGGLSVPVDHPFTGYGRSSILAPIDEHCGTNDGVLYEADSGENELVLQGEVDLEALARSRQSSEATILKDRRPGTYQACYRLF